MFTDTPVIVSIILTTLWRPCYSVGHRRRTDRRSKNVPKHGWSAASKSFELEHFVRKITSSILYVGHDGRSGMVDDSDEANLTAG